MTKSEAKFTIILPIYNVEIYLDRCIKSILKQTYDNFELICVNDSSPDNSQAIVDKYAQNDSRIKIIINSENRGLGAARNIALREASGQYLCCVDSDDWIETNFLELMKKGFETDVDSVWVKHWKYIEKLDYATISPNFPRYIHRLQGKIKINPENILNFPAYAWNKSYRTEYVKSDNFHWMENVYFEDMYFYYDYFMKYPNVYLIDELAYYYREREGSIVARNDIKLKKITDMFKVLTSIYDLVKQRNYSPEFKNSVVMSAKRYKSQYINSEFSSEVQQEYEKIINHINNAD